MFYFENYYSGIFLELLPWCVDGFARRPYFLSVSVGSGHFSYFSTPVTSCNFCVSGGRVAGAWCEERPEDSSGPGGLHQQEGGQTDRHDCGVWGHALRRAPPDREKTEGDRWFPEGTVVEQMVDAPCIPFYFLGFIFVAWQSGLLEQHVFYCVRDSPCIESQAIDTLGPGERSVIKGFLRQGLQGPARAWFLHFLRCLLDARADIYHAMMTHNFCTPSGVF